MHWYWRSGMSYWIVVGGSVFLLIAQLSPRFRHASLWYRIGYLAASLLGILWSGLGFYLLSHQAGSHTDLPWPRYWMLYSVKSDVGGLALGIFIALATNPESWRRSARTTPASNQSLQPTAGRSDD
jgi:hypothetical protein